MVAAWLPAGREEGFLGLSGALTMFCVQCCPQWVLRGGLVALQGGREGKGGRDVLRDVWGADIILCAVLPPCGNGSSFCDPVALNRCATEDLHPLSRPEPP